MFLVGEPPVERIVTAVDILVAQCCGTRTRGRIATSGKAASTFASKVTSGRFSRMASSTNRVSCSPCSIAVVNVKVRVGCAVVVVPVAMGETTCN